MEIPGLSYVIARTRELLLSPGSDISLASLATAFVIAMLFTIWKRSRRGRSTPLRVLLRGFFPRKLLFGASTRADIGYLVINTFGAGLLLGWAILSYHTVGKTTLQMLVSGFGAVSPTSLPGWAARSSRCCSRRPPWTGRCSSPSGSATRSRRPGSSARTAAR